MNQLQKINFALNQGINICIQKIPSLKKILSKPSYIQIETPYPCNLKCKQCNRWKKKKKDLDTEEMKKIIKDLRKWLGPFHLSFSGGEPLLRKDMPELIKLSSKLGIMTNLITNGILLDKEITNQLLESELDLLTVSLDGIKETTHDYIRGVKGTYKKVIKNINYSKKKLRIRIATLLVHNNLDEIIPLTKWVKKNNLFGIYFQAFQPDFGEMYNPLRYKTHKLWPKNDQKIDYVLNSIIEMKKYGYFISNTENQLRLFKEYYKNPIQKIPKCVCKTGTKNLKISFDGKVRLCGHKNFLGNITHKNICSIWESEKASKIRDSIKNCRRICALLNCNFEKGLIEEIRQFLELYK